MEVLWLPYLSRHIKNSREANGFQRAAIEGVICALGDTRVDATLGGRTR